MPPALSPISRPSTLKRSAPGRTIGNSHPDHHSLSSAEAANSDYSDCAESRLNGIGESERMTRETSPGVPDWNLRCMLLQTNSYVVPKEKRSEHARLLRRFKQVLHRLGCDQFEVYEQVGTNWTSDQNSGRFVQIMRFKDRKQQLAVQAAERDDPMAQAVIAEFCELINFPYQQQQGLFAIGYYTSILSSGKMLEAPAEHAPAPTPEPAPAAAGAMGEQMTMVVDREELVDVIDESKPRAEGEVHHSPFADAPIVAGVEVAQPAKANGDGHAADSVSPQAQEDGALPHVAGNDLDELIRQRFGELDGRDDAMSVGQLSVEDAPPAPQAVETEGIAVEGVLDAPEVVAGDARNVEWSVPAPEVAGEQLAGSGIGAVLDASLHGDDSDLDIALPAELVEPPDSSGAHASRPSHVHNEDRGHR